jgi:hypothetical protein
MKVLITSYNQVKRVVSAMRWFHKQILHTTILLQVG